MKIRLIKDLSSYDEHLVIGAEGTARTEKITFNDWGGEMVEVKIPGAVSLPIGWNALEIIDKAFWKDRERDIKQSVNIIQFQGSRGGFKGLRIISRDRSKIERVYSTSTKLEANTLLELAKKYNKPVSIEIVT